MNQHLLRWIGDADAVRHIERFKVDQITVRQAEVRARTDDYYIALVGELFTRMRTRSEDADGWSRLGNALALIAAPGQEQELKRFGISQPEATLFAAAAFYCGGFPASANITIKSRRGGSTESESYLACTDLLERPTAMRSQLGRYLLDALERGALQQIEDIRQGTARDAATKLDVSATEWIPARLLENLVRRFASTNVRAVLPYGDNPFWTPFVQSLVRRRIPIWDFFPSQIEAIKRGLIESEQTFSLQMPTSAGKTTLMETLLYWHAGKTQTDIAILLVPYRSLASELKGSLVRHLNDLRIPAKCIYGGTVPAGDEVHDLAATRVIIATPEALSGLLNAGELVPRISLVICDEGHLLDGEGRGVGLEMLLARLKARLSGPPRFIFISAIVPNVEEINSWLGGDDGGVVRSSYRPAIAEYSVLRTRGDGVNRQIDLEMHPQLEDDSSYRMANFLGRSVFQYKNEDTGRINTYSFGSNKVLAVAAARKALEIGVVALFAGNKRGDRGAIGMAEELSKQLALPLDLPSPQTYADQAALAPVVAYLAAEYGRDWLGTKTASSGAVLHHGDIPQETREVLENLLRQEAVRFVICTSTLAEGVNLPIRTLVLYSVQRNEGQTLVNLKARDIKNLVGRAGRAGATTKGLVICVDENQWHLVERVALETASEPVHGALLKLVTELGNRLALEGRALTNDALEKTPDLFELIDGIDSTLIDLAAVEIGEAALIDAALRVVDQTFAAKRADASTKTLLRSVFELRARRIAGLGNAGHLEWIRSSGARPRLIDTVESNLLTASVSWATITDPVDLNVVAALFNWAWHQPEFQEDVRDAFRLAPGVDALPSGRQLYAIVQAWLQGKRFVEVAASTAIETNELLGIYTAAIAYSLQTLVEQGVALLEKLLEARGVELSPAVLAFPEHLRYGVPTAAARILSSSGVRHRWAAVSLGQVATVNQVDVGDRSAVLNFARASLRVHSDSWRTHLGNLIFDNTVIDLGA
nr:DEAD/DEAH box helicase [uncultured Comamonas sp.]